MFHGTDDEILPVARSDEMSAALSAVGAPCRYSRLEGRPHSIGREVYQNGELWNWLLAQSRTADRAEPDAP
jgi:predicted esterase